ncbi:hypothetical protein BB558_003162, partial [Smittium angustum]
MNQNIQATSLTANTIHGLPIPNKEKLKELSLILPHVLPQNVLPMRLPEFINKLKNKKYPSYFVLAVLAAGINFILPTRTEDDIQLEANYAKKSVELMKKETDISDPLIVWSCSFILEYTHRTVDSKLIQQIRDTSEMAVKKTRLYQLDINKNLVKFKYGYTEDELEFRRRVWWVYYLYITGIYIFNGNFITFEQRDIVVNLPRNDFKYRYGGSFEGCNDKELKLLNDIANDPSDRNHPEDFHYLVVNTLSLYKNISIFVAKRWRKDHFDEDGANLRLVLYINQLLKLKDKLDQTLGDSFPAIKDKYSIYKEGSKLILETESHLVNHNLRLIYYSMFICLYQSELVRDLSIKIRPERVKAAKQQCIHASIKQMELMEWYGENIPTQYKGFPNISWSLNSLVSLTNFFFIKDPSLKEKHTDYFNRVVSIYKSFEKNSRVVDTMLMFINAMTKIKTKASENNKKYIHLLENMKPFGVSEHDLEPWIIPRYGSFFHSFCCGKSNFSTLDIGEYLGENITTVSIIQNELYLAAYKELKKSQIQYQKQEAEAELPGVYLSQINMTILNLTKGFQIKRSIVIDTGLDIEDFIRVNPLVLYPPSLTENNEVSESNLEPKIYSELQKSPKIIQKQKKQFANMASPSAPGP